MDRQIASQCGLARPDRHPFSGRVRPWPPVRKAVRGLLACGVASFWGATATAAYVYTNIDVPVPTTVGTIPGGINDSGEIAGLYVDAVGEHGYTVIGGLFSTVDVPLAQPGSTVIYGVNNSGALSGFYTDGGGNTVGFVDLGGIFTTITIPGATFVTASGRNGAGEIVGTYNDASGGSHGFTDVGGAIATLDDPLALPGQSDIAGITDAGMIFGTYQDASLALHGYTDVGGVFTQVDDPLGADGTFLEGASTNGSLAGFYVDALGVQHGFVEVGGVFQAIDDPAATDFTNANGINDQGQVVGVSGYGDVYHGFLATPLPEPEVWTMLLAGLGAAAASRRLAAKVEASLVAPARLVPVDTELRPADRGRSSASDVARRPAVHENCAITSSLPMRRVLAPYSLLYTGRAACYSSRTSSAQRLPTPWHRRRRHVRRRVLT